MASWQVDIPGLSQLIVGAGVHGLKQLALSRVDIHTIGCMLMVSELIPASQGFRLTLVARREKQRKESQWLYNVVEIGAGSSFLIDHFLKTRAGENVLALLVSIIPLMSPDACTATLATLFEVAGVSLDHTPGVSQFAKLRLALVSFARNVGFQERVLQYYSLFERITMKEQSRGQCPFDAIPSRSDLPRIIQFCHKIATAGENAPILVFKGFRGSAWVAAYTSFILGFWVCAIDGAGNQVPISNNYGKAKVILDLAAKESVCELQVQGHLNDFISIEPLDGNSRFSWIINCSELDFLFHNLPDLDVSGFMDDMAEIAAVSTMNEVVKRALYISIEERSPSFQTYFESVCPQIQKRSLDILRTLGLKTKQRHEYHVRSNIHDKANRHCAYLADDSISNLEAYMDVLSAIRGRARGKYKSADLDNICQVLERAIIFASQLAFTDWNTGLQTMSAAYFHGQSTRHTKLTRTYLYTVREPGAFEGLAPALLACLDVTEEKTLKQKIWTPDWLGISLDGVVVLRALLSFHSITKLQGMIFSFVPGFIFFEEQPRESIRMAFERDLPTKPIKNPDPDTRPVDIVPLLRSRFLVTGSGDTLWASQEIFNGPDLFAVAHPVEISVAIRKMVVAPPCRHGYDAVMKTTSRSLHDLKLRRHVEVLPGFTLYQTTRGHGETELGGKLTLYYQQVDQNDLAQWLAFQWHRGFHYHSVLILQENSCLECIVRAVTGDPDYVSLRTFGAGVICVVSGNTGYGDQ